MVSLDKRTTVPWGRGSVALSGLRDVGGHPYPAL